MRKIKLLGVITVVLLLFIAGLFVFLQSKKTVTVTGKVKVVATFYPIYFLAKEIGGDQAEVINIIPFGTEPHEYEPTAKQMAAIEDSDLFIANGIVEPWAASLSTATRGRYIEAGKGLFDPTTNDPHVWLEPSRYEKMAEAILAGYLNVNPSSADYYRANAESLAQRLAILDKQFAVGLKTCARREIVTAHAAFAYLASAYGLTQTSIAGLSPDAEPTPQQMIELATFVKSRQIGYIFVESLASPKFAQAIASETGASILTLDPIEGVSEQEAEAHLDYIGKMRVNLDNLQTALQCAK